MRTTIILVNRDRLTPLKFLHLQKTLNQGKLDRFRIVPTEELKESLRPDQEHSLKVRPDGTILDGHHRVQVLIERGENVNGLPREIIEKDDEF